jgi:hypothetical protein
MSALRASVLPPPGRAKPASYAARAACNGAHVGVDDLHQATQPGQTVRAQVAASVRCGQCVGPEGGRRACRTLRRDRPPRRHEGSPAGQHRWTAPPTARSAPRPTARGRRRVRRPGRGHVRAPGPCTDRASGRRVPGPRRAPPVPRSAAAPSRPARCSTASIAGRATTTREWCVQGRVRGSPKRAMTSVLKQVMAVMVAPAVVMTSRPYARWTWARGSARYMPKAGWPLARVGTTR